MPCDTITNTSVELKLANRTLLRKAVEDIAVKGSVREYQNYGKETVLDFTDAASGLRCEIVGQEVRVSENRYNASQASKIANRIKQGYTKEVVGYAARQFGLQMTYDPKTRKGTLKSRF